MYGRAGYAYYGEYPLSFAACFGYEDIYDYLINHGADPNRQDSFGNNVLHMMVVVNQTVRMCPAQSRACGLACCSGTSLATVEYREGPQE